MFHNPIIMILTWQIDYGSADTRLAYFTQREALLTDQRSNIADLNSADPSLRG